MEEKLIYMLMAISQNIDTYYYFANQQHTESIWHIMNLKPGDQRSELVVKGEKRPESEGTRVYILQQQFSKQLPKKMKHINFHLNN